MKVVLIQLQTCEWKQYTRTKRDRMRESEQNKREAHLLHFEELLEKKGKVQVKSCPICIKTLHYGFWFKG